MTESMDKPGAGQPSAVKNAACLLCDPAAADATLHRIEVWSDRIWRLTMALRSEVLGFSYLEPRRHVAHVEDLDGDEAASFGRALAITTAALKDQTLAERVYVYIFGEGIPHLHLHLAPHRRDDALSDQMVRGEFIERPLRGGATELISKDFPLLDEEELSGTAERVKQQLSGTSSMAVPRPGPR
jgi:diadenosine tetraphosphate (Ap4A) HIT family hydrolase